MLEYIKSVKQTAKTPTSFVKTEREGVIVTSTRLTSAETDGAPFIKNVTLFNFVHNNTVKCWLQAKDDQQPF